MTQNENSFSVIKLGCLERPTDRFLGAEVEQLVNKGQEVVLVSAVEIANRWQTAIDLGNAIRATFVSAYRDSPQRSVLTKFESALKAVNQLLDETTAKVPEPVHCALGVFSAGQLYFSTINNGHLLLYRRQKLTQITGAHLAGERFASVTSGELKKGDWLIAGSGQLRDALKNSQPDGWTEASKADLLRRLTSETGETGYAKLAGVAIEPASEYHLETIKLSGLKSAAGRWPALPATGFNLSVVSLKLGEIIGKIGLRLKATAGWLGGKLRRPKAPAVVASEIDYDDEVEALIPPPPRKKRFPVVTAVIAVVVLALLVAGVVIIRGEFRRVSQKPTVATSTIAELITKTAPSDLFAFIEQNLTVDNYQNLTDKQRLTFNNALAAAKISLVNSTAKAADLTNPVAAMDNVGNNLYLIDSTGQLWKFTDKLAKVTQASLTTNPVGLAALADNKIVVADQAGQLWLYDGSADQPHALPLPAALTQGPKLVQKFGSSNLYLYQTTTNAAYKVAGFIHDIFPASQVPPAADGTPPPAPTPTITSAVLNFGTLADWAVPGDFIGVTAAGVVKNFTKSKLESLNIQYYQDNAPIHLSLTGKDNEVAVARGKFVTVYSTQDGHKISEHAIVTDQMITDLSPGPGGSLFVTAGKTLYKIQ